MSHADRALAANVRQKAPYCQQTLGWQGLMSLALCSSWTHSFKKDLKKRKVPIEEYTTSGGCST